MTEPTEFVDVLLPLALPMLFTYRIPRDSGGYVQPFVRVIVPFGKRKKITGLAIRIHQEVPREYAAKYVEAVLDEQPVISESNYKFWNWIAEYYFCTTGEVMAAALPSGLKLNSETVLLYNHDVADEDLSHLSSEEHLMLDIIKQVSRISWHDAEKKAYLSKSAGIIKKLLKNGLILQEEEVKQKFKPLTETYVELVEDYQDESVLNELIDRLKRAPKQQELLLAFLSISRFFSDEPKPVKKLELLQKSNAGLAPLDGLVKKGIFDLVVKEVSRLSGLTKAADELPVLSQAQQQAFNEIEEGFKVSKPCLLYGITSSGKTEVYIHLIHQCLKAGKQVLYLLPEIALTTQIISRLRTYFGTQVLVYHSRFSENERVEIWKRVTESTTNQRPVVVLGARSALFMPLDNLGLLIVDEEHDASYKQSEPAPRYHARDAAIYLAKSITADIVLGSATPSMESYFQAQSGKYHLVKLLERYANASMPEVLINDLRIDRKKQRLKNMFSPLLLGSVSDALQKEQQVILFQNRRGFAPYLECQACHWVPHCRQCDISLTYHKAINQLRCHYCGYMENVPAECYQCKNTDIRMMGYGTEKVEEDLAVYVPDAVIKRMDLDSTRSKYAFHKLIEDFENQRIQILVGTQMVTKGLDFDHVSVVGILNADSMLNFPDFRAYERAFQLMSQVAGRAGRRETPGKVIIQTYQPTHEVLGFVQQHSFESFYENEIFHRKEHFYPPFCRIIHITVKNENQHKTDEAALVLAELLRPVFGNRMLGPEYPTVAKVRNQFQKRVLLKTETNLSYKKIRQSLSAVLQAFSKLSAAKNIRVVVDIDPT